MAQLIQGWGGTLASIEVVPGTGGVFDVDVNGERVFTKAMIGRYPEPDDVLPLIRDAIGPETMRIGASSGDRRRLRRRGTRRRRPERAPHPGTCTPARVYSFVIRGLDSTKSAVARLHAMGTS